MPSEVALLEGPPEALDRVYAQSLFELAEEKGGRALVEEIGGEIHQIDEARGHDPQIREFFRSLIVPAREKERVIAKAFGGRVNPLLANFLLLLARKERIDRLGRIFKAYDEMVQERYGRVEVDLFTRYPLSPAEVESIRAALAAKMQREPIVHAYVDETMLGGIRIQAGDKLLDASVDAQLRRMKERLSTEGAGVVRERIERMFEG